jgi:hypothetical protein
MERPSALHRNGGSPRAGNRGAAGVQLKDTDVMSAYNMLIEILNNPESEEQK